MTEEPKKAEPASAGGLDLKNIDLAKNWPLLLVILLTSGGNFLATNNSSKEQAAELQKAINEVHELHRAMDDFKSRQKDILNNDQAILAELKKIEQK